MFKIIKTLLIMVLFFSFYIGSIQLGSNNDVFASSMARCCNNGLCHNANCATTSSIEPCSGSGYISTCRGCMNVIYSLINNCDGYIGTLPTWCLNDDGTKHYAVELE